MVDQWQIRDAIKLMRLAKYLISVADDRGKTHGEKHHLHEVSGMMLKQALLILDYQQSPIDMNLDANIVPEIPDVPF